MYRTLLILLMICIKASAQTVIPFDSPRWKIKGEEAVQETHMGKPALRLKKAMALLEDADFRNGIIEYDIALTKDRYFPGIDFRIQDEGNHETYYIRPHQSGNPDAMQYTPTFNGLGGFQLYYGPGYNNAAPLPFDRWLHVKILVHEKQAEVYFDNDTTPVLFIDPLKREVASGKIALTNLSPATTWYSSFSYTKSDDVTFRSKPRPVPPLPPGVITSWQVSSTFSENVVKEKLQLSAADTASLTWKKLDADALGVTDFAMLSGITKTSNTVFARMVIHADKPGIKKLTFGFSDRARVYLNHRLLYEGHDEFVSRDYRFLGTIGYFDAVYLDMKKGNNELWIAVSEDFGGWGLKARLE